MTKNSPATATLRREVDDLTRRLAETRSEIAQAEAERRQVAGAAVAEGRDVVKALEEADGAKAQAERVALGLEVTLETATEKLRAAVWADVLASRRGINGEIDRLMGDRETVLGKVADAVVALAEGLESLKGIAGDIRAQRRAAGAVRLSGNVGPHPDDGNTVGEFIQRSFIPLLRGTLGGLRIPELAKVDFSQVDDFDFTGKTELIERERRRMGDQRVPEEPPDAPGRAA